MTDRTKALREFMEAFEQTVRTTPTAQISPEEQVLRVNLVIEEALEFAEAMGVAVGFPMDLKETRHSDVAAYRHKIKLAAIRPIDLVEAADALADLSVVCIGSELTLGIPGDDVFETVHENNMSKLGPDGHPIKNEIGRVVKPAGWRPPDIRKVLVDDGWDGMA